MDCDADLLIVFHNSRQWVPELLDSLRQISIPVTAYFLDNASTDNTADVLAEAVSAADERRL